MANNNQNGQNTQNNNGNNGQKNGLGKILDTVAAWPAKILRAAGNGLLKTATAVEEHPIGTVATGVATYIVIKNKDSLIESGKNLLNGGNDGNVNQVSE